MRINPIVDRLLCAMAAIFLAVMLCVSSADSQDAPPTFIPDSGPISISGSPAQLCVLPEDPALIRGFTVSVSMDGGGSYGYATLEISFDSTIALPAQRAFVLRLTPTGRHFPARNATVVEIPITAEQGKRQTVIKRRIPKWTIFGEYDVALIEDGKQVADYVATLSSTNAQNRLRSVEHMVSDEYFNKIVGTDSAIRQQVNTPQSGWMVQPIIVKQLPNDWRDYRQVDAILLTYPELKSVMESADPTVGDALRDWVLMGGTIVINGCDDSETLSATLDFKASADKVLTDEFADYVTEILTRTKDNLLKHRAFEDRIKLIRDTMDELAVDAPSDDLSVPASDATGSSDGESATEMMSEPMMVQLGKRVLEKLGRTGKQAIDEQAAMSSDGMMAMGSPDMYNTDPWTVLNELDNLRPPVQTDVTREGLPTKNYVSAVAQYNESVAAEIERHDALFDRWMVAPVGGGRVIWTTSTIPMTPSEMEALHWWTPYRASAMLRRGIDPFVGDSRSARWMIPGVAQPPVYTFMGLLGLFVILVGPIAYRQTSKAGRSHLMFAIAPVLAILTTAALLGYSFTADGFGTKTRVRQLTWVDGHSGDAAERVRATYFAGISPSQGLRFDGAAEVMPYHNNRSTAWEEFDDAVDPDAAMARVVVDEDGLRLGRSFLPARSQEQFISSRPRMKVGTLQLTPSIGGSQPPTVTSTMGFELTQLVVRDADGAYWTVDGLDANAQGVKLTALPSDPAANEASKKIGKMYSKYRPIAGFTGNTQSSTTTPSYGYNRRTLDMISTINSRIDTGDSGVTDGVMEDWLTRKMLLTGELPRKSFVALSDVTRDVIAVPDAEVVESIRYVFGTLR
ncbi:hypothetical protein [Stieleria varia]|uniref:Uncharacterized protein n=1 Tax=Stieleria varia TaxID=2528005 RepID=A0A5C6AP93_9BACT|nr:hypothetical protein [Stieleria varia]TWU01241.1 hypothetical protein Pla52n_46140 [Stieleria varia]